MGTIRASDVRQAARALGRFSWDDLCNRLGPLVQSYADRKHVKNAVKDFRKRGEVERIGEALFEYRNLARPRSRIDVVWHLVRSHRAFSADEIERLSGAARATVLEYLQCLAKTGLIMRVGPGRWKLVRDPGPDTPVNTAKCKKLKALRARKRG